MSDVIPECFWCGTPLLFADALLDGPSGKVKCGECREIEKEQQR